MSERENPHSSPEDTTEPELTFADAYARLVRLLMQNRRLMESPDRARIAEELRRLKQAHEERTG